MNHGHISKLNHHLHLPMGTTNTMAFIGIRRQYVPNVRLRRTPDFTSTGGEPTQPSQSLVEGVQMCHLRTKTQHPLTRTLQLIWVYQMFPPFRPSSLTVNFIQHSPSSFCMVFLLF